MWTSYINGMVNVHVMKLYALIKKHYALIYYCVTWNK